MTKTLLLLASVLLAACVRAPASPSAAPLNGATLVASDGGAKALDAITAHAPYTVMVFISAECPCLDAHLDRLRALHGAYADKGVQFFAVDSEVGGSPERAAAEARSLALPFPVLVDGGAKLANAVGAEYATYTIALDREGRVRYRGGIDSDKRKLHDDATRYVADALDDLLAGREPRRTEGKALGCSLRKW